MRRHRRIVGRPARFRLHKLAPAAGSGIDAGLAFSVAPPSQIADTDGLGVDGGFAPRLANTNGLGADVGFVSGLVRTGGLGINDSLVLPVEPPLRLVGTDGLGVVFVHDGWSGSG